MLLQRCTGADGRRFWLDLSEEPVLPTLCFVSGSVVSSNSNFDFLELEAVRGIAADTHLRAVAARYPIVYLVKKRTVHYARLSAWANACLSDSLNAQLIGLQTPPSTQVPRLRTTARERDCVVVVAVGRTD